MDGLARINWLVKDGDVLRGTLTPNRPALQAIEAKHSRWRESVAHALAHVRDGLTHLQTFQESPDGPLPDEFRLRQKEVNRRLDTDIECLRSIADRCASVQVNSTEMAGVFLVHGRDELVKLQVQQFLTQVLGRSPVVIDQYAGAGLTLIDKFEKYATQASIAVVLVTGDDEGRLGDDSARSLGRRARQNVIFELGYFRARLGAARVIVLKEESVEFPSDLFGVCYVSLLSDWRLKLVGELQAAGAGVDPRRLVQPS